MKWVVGTGRCGLHNYTALNDGFIEATDKFKECGHKKFHGDPYDEDHVRSVIRDRMKRKAGCITDCGQFMFIDIIAEEDPDAEFIWIIRDKDACVESFMNRPNEDKRIHPKGWDFAHKNKMKLIIWYYDTVNETIEKLLEGKKFTKIRTEDMEKVVDSRGFLLEGKTSNWDRH